MAKATTVVDDPTRSPHEAHAEMAQCWLKYGTKDEMWVGFFIDFETALAWVKSRPNPDAYTVNNVPPHTSNSRKTVKSPFGERQTTPADVMPTRRTVIPSKPVRQTQAETAGVRRLKQDAAKRLDKHRRDEAADLERERNEQS